MTTNNNAQIRELIERDAAIMNNAMGLTNTTLGVVLRAAQNATGTEIISAIAVPKVAMLKVSHKGRHSVLL